MSERGSFVTEFVYCDKCLEVLRDVLCTQQDKYLVAGQLPSWEPGKLLPIIAGKIGGLYPGSEIHEFEIRLDFDRLCHDVRIAVLAEHGEQIFKFGPNDDT